ncbi:MAG: penicillin-binding protein [Hyphomicrobiales bacterium]|nr:penicillin-binding protein [Hyphomicrobiales bacterium]
MRGLARTNARRGPRRRFALAIGVVAAMSLGAPGAWRAYLGALGPLDLSSLQRGSAVAVDRDGRLLRAFTSDDGRWRLPVRAHEVDPRFLALLQAYEDRRFMDHRGLDHRAFLRAAGQFVRNGRVVSGGSTLTMQAARLLEPRDLRTPAAKLRQIVRAVELERRFGKAEILDIYLALAPYGGNLEGLRAASLAYFGKEPRRLALAEQAMLVALPQSPETRRPDRDPAAAKRARDRVLDRAAGFGAITRAEAEAAKAEPVPAERRPFPAVAPHSTQAAHDAQPQARTLRFAYDQRLQVSLEQLAREAAERVGPKVTAAMVAIDNASGEIRARVGSADYFAPERAGAVDMTSALRSPGSALKPFIYALAFEDGIAHPETALEDRPARFGVYAPENFDQTFQGRVTARTALQQSLNVPAVALLAEVGAPRFLARLRNAGAHVALSGDAAPGLAVGLGGVGITLVDLARLYAGLARGGAVPDLVDRLDLPRPPASDRRVAEAVSSWYVADVLRGAPPPVNAPAGRLSFKTGTSYGYRDAVAVGFDARLTIAVWFGRADNGAVPGLVARQVAAPVLFDAFARAGSAYEIAPRPPGALVAATGALPPPLRHLRKDAAKTLAGAQTPQLRIAYPPDGARVDLGLRQGAETELALKALGGVAPFTWLVNGAPVGAPDLRRQSAWKPDGAGFARVSVMDARGASDSVVVRVE